MNDKKMQNEIIEEIRECANCGYQLFPEDKVCQNCDSLEEVEIQEKKENDEGPKIRESMELVGKISEKRFYEIYDVNVPQKMQKYQGLITLLSVFCIISIICAPICLIALFAGENFSFGPLIVMGIFIVFALICFLLMKVFRHILNPYIVSGETDMGIAFETILREDFNINGEVKRIHLLVSNNKNVLLRHRIYACRDGEYVYLLDSLRISKILVKDFVTAELLKHETIIFMDERPDLVKDLNRQSGIIKYYSSNALGGMASMYKTQSIGMLIFNTDGIEWSFTVLPYSLDAAKSLLTDEALVDILINNEEKLESAVAASRKQDSQK